MSMTAVAVTGDGARCVVAWKDMRSGSPRVWWSESAGNRFAGDVAVAAGGKAEEDHPAVVLDATGSAWVAWEQGSGPGSALCLRATASKSAPMDLANAAQGVPAFPVLAAMPGGLVVAWETSGDGGGRVFARVLTTASR